jgi:capsular polysaccharide export protein
VPFSYGLSLRKRKCLAAFVGEPVAPAMPWTRSLPDHALVYVWGAQQLPARLQRPDIKTVRVEDGFLRSVGLGAAFAPPISWTFDRKGLHHWGHSPSDLEELLQHCDLTDRQLQTGAEILQRLRSHRLSKYNEPSGEMGRQLLRMHEHQGIKVLVVGQVADDAALKGIQTPVRTNMQLLASVRKIRPAAYIAYKRHPDVTAGLRRGDDERAMDIAHGVIEGVSLQNALPLFDEVHVLNSLSGFEALVAGKRVVCHAQPFYAGWGLTQDLQPCERRTRKLSLEELAYVALARYPVYLDPQSGERMGVLAAIEYLTQLRKSPPKQTAGLLAGRLMHMARNLLHPR